MQNDPHQSNESLGSPHASYAAMGGLGSLDQVRDILFGSHMREINERFQQLEERLEREVADLNTRLQGQFETLEGIIQDGWARTDARLQEEAEQRDALEEDLYNKHEDMRQMMDRARAELEAQIAVTDEMFRELLSEQSQALMDKLRVQEQVLQANLQHIDERLDEKKVDRVSLAGLFHQVAAQLLDAEQAERSPLSRPDWDEAMEADLSQSEVVPSESTSTLDAEREPSSAPEPVLAIPQVPTARAEEENASMNYPEGSSEALAEEDANGLDDDVVITIPEPEEAKEKAPDNPPPLPMTFDVDVALAEAMESEVHADDAEQEEPEIDSLPADRN